MSSFLSTNLNVSPFFDDFDETKNFHQILFKPAFAVQARELTQLQSILQNQVARFGQNILKEGTIVKGGNFVELPKLDYIKLRDNTTTNSLLDVNNFLNKTVVGSITGLKAVVVGVVQGLESQKPDLNTLYIKYITTVNDIKVFDSTENINIISDTDVVDYSVTATIAGAVDTGATPAVGAGYGVICGDGVIFQKGYFIRFADGLTIVSKYNSTPNDVVVGFQTKEEIITSTQDGSLLDNASGFNNYTAPGADRLKLTPVLVTKTLADARTDKTFFAIQEYINGRVVRRRTDTQFNSVEKMVEKRTHEESGNYYVDAFPIIINTHPTDPDNLLSLSIGRGLAYVEGKRVRTYDTTYINIDKPQSFSQVSDQDVIANYGNYVIVNTITSPFVSTSAINLEDAVGVIGTAKFRTLTKIDNTNSRAFIFDVRMNSGKTFSSVTKLTQSTSSATLVLESGKAVLKDASFNSLVYPLGKSFVKTISSGGSSFVFRGYHSGATGAGTTLTITLSVGNSWLYSGALNSLQLADLVIINDTDNTQTTSFTASVSGQQLTIAGLTASKTYSVYYNAKKDQLSPSQKTLKTIYVKVNCSSNTGGVYGLGVPNVSRIVGIWKGATYSESNTDVTSSFRLNQNVSDAVYGLSYISAKAGVSLTGSDLLLVKAEVFETTTTGDCATVDSYVYTGSNITFQDIPVYINEAGRQITLRDAVDFRPEATATSVYATTIAAATIITAAFNPATFALPAVNIPAPNSSIDLTYQYYKGRNDLVYIDDSGEFQVFKGVESNTPVTPKYPTKGFVLAELHIPPYPALAYSEAVKVGKAAYGVQSVPTKQKRYTMEDVGEIDTRLKNLEDYVALSLLEKSAADLAIKDSAGLNRFKNGIFVDNFESLSFAAVSDTDFAASIDTTNSEIKPKFISLPIDLKIASTSNTTAYGSLVTLNKTDVSFMDQPYASRQKNCTTSFYKFSGNLQLNPEYDSGVNTVRAPDIVLDIDLTTPFVEYTSALSSFVPLQSVTRSTNNTVARNGSQTITTSTTTTTAKSLSISNSTVKDVVGDFVSDIRFMPFMRTKDLQLYATGLRPDTRFYVYFDGVAVDAHVAKAQIVNGIVTRSSAFGGQVLRSDSNGNLAAIFRIPADTFYVGQRKIEIMDVNLYSSVDAVTSYTSKSYNAFNYQVSKSSLVTSTRVPEVEVDTSTSSSSRITTTTAVRPFDGDRSGDKDPLAQTFFVDANSSDDTNIFITKVDLFFATKSSNRGVTVEIREVENGYPGGLIVPFSQVHVPATSINVNDLDGSTATTVTFKAPVALKTDAEYAIVIRPDANDPNYKVWVSKVGDTDLLSGKSITHDTNSGMVFTSTNNRAWIPYQDENLKFKLYKAKFTSSTGSVTLESNNYEFLNVSNIAGNGQFIEGEKIFSTNSVVTANVNVTPGNTVITGDINFQSQFAAGEYIVIKKGTEYNALKITSANTTAVVVSDIPTLTVAGNQTAVYKSTVGTLTYLNTSVTPALMVLSDSNAKTTLKFANTNTIVGETSGVTGTINVVNLPISYIQPSIFRSNFTKTNTQLSGTFDNVAGSYTTEIQKGTNYLTAEPTYIKSKSNILANTTFSITCDLVTSGVDTSPVVDHSISSVMAYQHVVNNDSTNELTATGNASSKYITKIVELAPGMDAEDIKVILTAYKPVGTDIKVYVRVKSDTDPTIINDVPWSELTADGFATISSSADLDDFKEVSYSLSTTTKTAGQGAYIVNDVIEYITSNGAVYKDFKKFAVKIVFLSDSHQYAPRIKDMRVLALS